MADQDGEQLGFWSIKGVSSGRHPNCLVTDFLENDDSACVCLEKSNFEVLECNDPKSVQYLADCRGVTFSNVRAAPVLNNNLPGFIPHAKTGSSVLWQDVDTAWVAVTLGDILSPQKLYLTRDIRKKFHISPEKKILLLNNGPDPLIEKVWTRRDELIPQIASLDVDAMTGIDYSIFRDQPHLERLVNMKRSLISFELFQKSGANAMPHVYWSSKKDMQRWAEWLHDNEEVSTISMYWGLLRKQKDWQEYLEELRYFNSLLRRPIHLIITGPTRPERILSLRGIIPNLTLTNSAATMAAINHLHLTDHERVNVYPSEPIQENTLYFSDLMKPAVPSAITEQEVFTQNFELGNTSVRISTTKLPEISGFLSESYISEYKKIKEAYGQLSRYKKS